MAAYGCRDRIFESFLMAGEKQNIKFTDEEIQLSAMIAESLSGCKKASDGSEKADPSKLLMLAVTHSVLPVIYSLNNRKQ